VLTKCPPGSSTRRTEQKANRFKNIAARLRGGGGVKPPSPRITSDLVERAISDAEALVASNGATSGVDRIHTALHGYVKAVCNDASISYGVDPSLTDLFKLLRKQHPLLAAAGPRSDDIEQVFRALATILNALNPVRNRASVAHPNENLLQEAEPRRCW
jgi:hypothetical protein